MSATCETQDLLIEIGTEELPPKALQSLSEAFASGLCSGLEQQTLSYLLATPFATPRRLAVLIHGVATMQADRQVERRGPALSAAFDKTGQPTKAALGFARSCGVDIGELEKLETDKGAWLNYRSIQPGQALATLLPEIIEAALAALPIPKRMRWGDFNYEFVRPVHWVVILLGNELIPANIFGIASQRHTYGHRFHHPQAIQLSSPAVYAKSLEESGFVIPAFATRREQVRILVEEAADHINGHAVIDDALLDEVTSLVEWPVTVTGCFDNNFLEIPPEVLIASMKGHQKYFPVVDGEGRLLPRFIAVANIASVNPDLVRAGNERVIRPRLSDAAFFWEQDGKTPLARRVESLKTVIFQSKLGSLYDKTQRLAKLTGLIAQQLGVDAALGIRAAELSKTDLLTDMVGEFPELQGIMGEYYARHDDEPAAVATALREQYMPRFWGDELPASVVGQALSIADKLDTLVGIFGIGQPPTGDKDPFGLRRASISLLRIMIECELPLDCYQLLQHAQSTYPGNLIQPDAFTQVFDFILERLRGYYQEQGVHYDSIDAVLACRPTSPLDAARRIRGIEAFRQLPQATSLASANKRIHNILKKASETFTDQPNPAHFNHAVEKALYEQMITVEKQITPLIQKGDYQNALQELATLREAVDEYFEHVMVMDENLQIRINRLSFLQHTRQLFLQIADISCLQLSK